MHATPHLQSWPTLAAVGWDALPLLPVVLALAAGVILLVVLLYRAQLRGGLRGRWLLPALRAAALLALLVSVLKPLARRARADADRGAVVILLDHSRSMSVRDAQRPAAQWVELADALGRLPPRGGVPDAAAAPAGAAVNDVRQKLDPLAAAQRDLDFAKLSGLDRSATAAKVEESLAAVGGAARPLLDLRPSLAKDSPLVKPLDELQKLLAGGRPDADGGTWVAAVRTQLDRLDASAANLRGAADRAWYARDPAVRAACEELQKLNRFELASAALVDPAAGLLPKLPAGTLVYGFALGEGVEPLPLRGPAGAGSPAVRKLLLGTSPLAPDAPRSDVVGGVRDALDRLRGVRVAAVVLLSDGRPDARQPRADAALATGVPLFAVAVAPEAPPRDAAVVSLHAPPATFAGKDFDVTVGTRGAGVPASWHLHLAGEEDEQAVIVPLGPTPKSQTFHVRLDTPGPQQLVARLPRVRDEITDENNVAGAWVKVIGQKLRVLLVRGSASWDYQYLRRALADVPWARVREVPADDPAGGAPSVTPGEIRAQDVVVLYDAPAGALSSEQRDALRSLVADRGGGVVVVAGRANPIGAFAGTPLADLLPFVPAAAPPMAWRQWPGEDAAYRPLPVLGADLSEWFGPADDPAFPRPRWQDLPPVFSFLLVPRLKPSAVPLLQVQEGARAVPVVVGQRLGAGRALFVGIDQTWRWRAGAGGREQDSFWRGVVRGIAEPPYALESGPLRFDLAQAAARPGEALHARARLRAGEGGEPAPPASVALDIFKADAGGALVRKDALPRLDPPSAGRYVAALAGLPAGRYRLHLSTVTTSIDYPLEVAEDYTAEMADLSGDRALLRKMADSTGGELLPLEQVNQLAARLEAVRAGRQPAFTDLRLWDSLYLFLFVAACLCAEWALRKHLGLA